MKTDTREIKDQLEEILEKNKDAQKGYYKAAENVDDASLRRYFERKAENRKTFNKALESEMVNHYEGFDTDGSFKGSIHRTWMDVKSLFSGNDDEAMLEESIRGDEAAVEEYKDVLNDTTLPAGIAQLIRKQKDEIQSTLSQNRTMEDIRS
jgi:uncharacterized protein (TIGR02284 family)